MMSCQTCSARWRFRFRLRAWILWSCVLACLLAFGAHRWMNWGHHTLSRLTGAVEQGDLAAMNALLR